MPKFVGFSTANSAAPSV